MFLQGPRDEFRRVADSRPARIVLILKAPARIRKIPQQFFHKDALRLRRRPRSVLFHIFLHALPRGNVPYVCLCVPRGVRLQILSQKQSADNQVERLICDQFRGCEIGKSDIAAAGGDGFGRLINTVQFRLDTGKLDGLEVKSAGIKLPDHPAPDM